ncbi:MAG: hypothetical protein RIQ79_228 [Verrucomicrobiota bacterium]
MILGPGAVLWLWALPMLLLLLLNLQGYALIEGNMDAAQRGHALILGLAGLLDLGAALTIYALVKGRIRRAADEAGLAVARSAWWGVPAVLVQVAYLWLAMSWDGTELLPTSVTAWIYPPERYLYNQFAFAMVPLFWGLMRIACARAPKHGKRTLGVNIALAIAAPVLLFLLFQAVMATKVAFVLGALVMITLVVGCGLAMFVGIIRALALWLRDIETWGAGTERIAILVFALGMPVGGLLLNREIPFPNDFQAWEVYALTAANAAVLLLASWQHTRRPLLSLGLLCATLPFTLYFFVVFLPFLPLSILGVILLGAGFLVLAPTMLLILHLCLLNKARRGPKGRRFATGAICFLLLPAFFTVRSLADKAALNAALDYVYAPAIKADAISYSSSLVNLSRALANHRSYKNGIYYPLLSDYYAWLVFDNLVLPDDKLARLESVFFGVPGSKESADPVRMRGGLFGGGRSNRERDHMPRSARPPRTVVEENLTVRVAPADGGASVVTLALTLKNTDSINAEYAHTLRLSAGVFVSGFRLFIDGKPVSGRITEKKTALWVYTMIRDSERRDPGLLFYNTPDELELRVFPVVAGQPSVVELDFLVPSADLGVASLADDTKDPAAALARIGERLHPTLVSAERGSVVAGGLASNPPPSVQRAPYLHVIVDRSADNGFDGDLPAALAQLAARYPTAARRPRVTLANYETVELPEAVPVTAASLAALPLRGGFASDLALAQALRRHRDADLDEAKEASLPPLRPVFVLLSRKNPTLPPSLGVAEAWLDLLPALEIQGLDANGAFTAWPVPGAIEAPLLRLGRSVRPLVHSRPVRFKNAPADASLQYWSPVEKSWRPVDALTRMEAGAPWAKAVALHLAQQDHDRTPGDAGVDLKRLVKESRESGVMLPSTSYIVVENSAQWRMLDVSERQKLDQNAALSFKETPAPSWVWLLAGFLGWLVFRRSELFRKQALRVISG